MLTSSGNQYLRPDYLQPLPTTLDAKKSPLALLAQTCSSIGQPDPPAQSKTIIPPIEKKEIEKSVTDKSANEEKSSFKPYEQIKKEDSENEPKSGFRTPISNKNTPVTSQSSTAGEKSPIPTNTTDTSAKSSENTAVTTVIQNPLTASVPSTPGIHSHNRISLSCGSMFVEVNHHESAALGKDGVAIQSSHLNALPSYKPGQLMSLPSPASLAHNNCAGCAQVIGHTIPVDPTSGAYPVGLTTHSGLTHPVSTSPIKHSSSVAAPALSPYVAYARVKTASGGTTLVPICRDPYCTNCQLSLQSAQLTTCPSGCTQCNHEAQNLSNAMGLSGATGPLSVVSGLQSGSLTPVSNAVTPGGTGSLPLSSYPHSVFAHRPYVCNWIAGDAYCGKRFGTSEELLQHLRTHTNLSTSDASSLPLITPSYSLGLQTATGLNGCHMHYSSATAYGSASLRRTYPTSLSPVSSLSASRYHPYKTSLPPLPGAPLPHPTIAPYYSPYTLYGPRVGAVAHQ